jgi:hypothetical protein
MIKKGFGVIDFFTFDTLITPYIIGYVYFTGAILLPFIILYYYKKSTLKIDNFKLKIYLLLTFILLEIFWRIFCEFFMVYFKIFLSLNS